MAQRCNELEKKSLLENEQKEKLSLRCSELEKQISHHANKLVLETIIQQKEHAVQRYKELERDLLFAEKKFQDQ